MKKILVTSNAWSTIHLSHQPSKPAWYILDWRISIYNDFGTPLKIDQQGDDTCIELKKKETSQKVSTFVTWGSNWWISCLATHMATKLAKHIGLIFEKISRNVSVEGKVESFIRRGAVRTFTHSEFFGFTKENSQSIT